MNSGSLGITKILIVEDNRIDARLLSHALKQVNGWHSHATILDDGEKAIEYLLGDEALSDSDRPDLIILDLNLPKRDGTEVLGTIRCHDRHKDMPVFILSSNPLDLSMDEVRKAELEADAYFEKPFEVGNFSDIARAIYAEYLAKRDVPRTQRAAT